MLPGWPQQLGLTVARCSARCPPPQRPGLGIGIPIACFYRVSAFNNPGILLAFTVRGGIGAGEFFALAASELVGFVAGGPRRGQLNCQHSQRAYDGLAAGWAQPASLVLPPPA